MADDDAKTNSGHVPQPIPEARDEGAGGSDLDAPHTDEAAGGSVPQPRVEVRDQGAGGSDLDAPHTDEGGEGHVPTPGPLEIGGDLDAED